MSRTLVAVALTLAALALPAAARAEVVRGPEPVGDELAWQVEPTDPFCGGVTATEPPAGSGAFDLTGISVRHKRYQVALTARFAEPRTRRTATFYLQTPHRRWMVQFDRVDGGRYLDLLPEPGWSLQDVDTDEDGTVDCQVWMGVSSWVPCDARPHASFAADHRSLHVVLPRRCLGNPRWVRAGGDSAGMRGDVAVIDSWDPAGPDTPDDVLGYDPNEHVYGPRVLAGPGAADEGSGETSPGDHVVRRTLTRSAYGTAIR